MRAYEESDRVHAQSVAVAKEVLELLSFHFLKDPNYVCDRIHCALNITKISDTMRRRSGRRHTFGEVTTISIFSQGCSHCAPPQSLPSKKIRSYFGYRLLHMF